MLFETKPQLFIDQTLLYRCHRLSLLDDVVYIYDDPTWIVDNIYEVKSDACVDLYYRDNTSYDCSLNVIYKSGTHIFHKGDKVLPLCTSQIHSINGLPDVYLDYNMIRWQMNNIINDIPDSHFADVVILNEMEYLDYLYGRD